MIVQDVYGLFDTTGRFVGVRDSSGLVAIPSTASVSADSPSDVSQMLALADAGQIVKGRIYFDPYGGAHLGRSANYASRIVDAFTIGLGGGADNHVVISPAPASYSNVQATLASGFYANLIITNTNSNITNDFTDKEVMSHSTMVHGDGISDVRGTNCAGIAFESPAADYCSFIGKGPASANSAGLALNGNGSGQEPSQFAVLTARGITTGPGPLVLHALISDNLGVSIMTLRDGQMGDMVLTVSGAEIVSGEPTGNICSFMRRVIVVHNRNTGALLLKTAQTLGVDYTDAGFAPAAPVVSAVTPGEGQCVKVTVNGVATKTIRWRATLYGANFSIRSETISIAGGRET